jgi:hypothetical protein
LPAYSQIFQRAEDLVIEDFFVGGSTYHLRLGQVGQARKLIDRIKDALSLTPSFSNALLAGIQSFATFALPRYDPSSRISLRVRRSESLEVYEICQMSELASDEQMLDAVRSWLESEDGHYYSNALSQISCTVADTIGFSSSSELGPGQLRQVDEQDDFPNVLCRVEKVIVSSQD